MWIIMAWQCISPELTVTDFKMCCIFNAMDETDDDMMWNVNEEEGYVRFECEEDEGNDCENGDSDTLIGKVR
jgi:predicted PolB exonuclease-like 3'-5' exonuclease